VSITQATRGHAELRLGASPRATLQLARASKARAALEGREFVLPDDVNALADAVLSHRVVPVARGGAMATAERASEVIASVLEQVTVPIVSLGKNDGLS
jgi:MoxR-like ATPase